MASRKVRVREHPHDRIARVRRRERLRHWIIVAILAGLTAGISLVMALTVAA